MMEVPYPTPDAKEYASSENVATVKDPPVAKCYPERAIIQSGFMPEIRDELLRRSIPVHVLSTDLGAADWASSLRHELRALGLCASDLVAAIPSWVDVALEERGIPVPPPPDYPPCLQHLLRRKVWKSTLGKVQEHLASGKVPRRVFIKPASGAKTFNGLIEPDEGMLDLMLEPGIFGLLGPDPSAVEVWCSEVVDMNSEYAVYVVNGVVRHVSHYMCKASSCRCPRGDPAKKDGLPPIGLDMAVVDEAVRRIAADRMTRALSAGYRADFALVRSKHRQDAFETALVEVNDGYVSGRYDDFDPADFTDMVIARFATLQQQKQQKQPGSPGSSSLTVASGAESKAALPPLPMGRELLVAALSVGEDSAL